MNNDLHLNIISFDIPYPPNYGGVIDVFYKIKSLSELGVKIHLHTFQYKGRKKAKILDEVCEEVIYYKRNRYKNPFVDGKPYIVKTRKSGLLLDNLKSNNYPILFEGLHTCNYLNHIDLSNRKKIVRMHNIENVYYKHLAKIENNPIKKAFFNFESENLKKFSEILKYADRIAAISKEDAKYLNVRFPEKTFCLPVFHQNNKIIINEQKGNYALYHGNLSVGENNKAAMYLIDKIFNDIDYKLIIAGSNPTKELSDKILLLKNIELKENLSETEMHDIIFNAQMHVLPTFQNTGIKLKLINVLFSGRHIIVNNKMIENTNIEDTCIIANTENKMKKSILNLINKNFDFENINNRKDILLNTFSNKENAKKLIEEIF
jgi:hypothetical protein